MEEDRRFHPEWPTLSIDWKDEGFRELLRASFTPRQYQGIQVTPHESVYLTAAIHVRRGGGVDPLPDQILWPMRFAPTSYYIECLKRLCQLFPNLPIYAHIFTDDLDPKRIAEEFQTYLTNLPIYFTFRQEGNSPHANILEDFFSMLHFDCLIRSASNYTLIPSLIGDYKVVMTPKHGYWTTDGMRAEYYIDEIAMDFK